MLPILIVIAVGAGFCAHDRAWLVRAPVGSEEIRKLFRARSRIVVHDYPSAVLQSEIVVHSLAEFLLASQIALSCLNRCVPKQELNLLNLPARQMA